MTAHNFMFTYSVSPMGDDERSADVIRSRIARLDGQHNWTKLEYVETAFKGKIHLFSSLIDSKRSEAKAEITKILQTVFDNNYPIYKVYVSVALLVDGLNEVIEFRF